MYSRFLRKFEYRCPDLAGNSSDEDRRPRATTAAISSGEREEQPEERRKNRGREITNTDVGSSRKGSFALRCILVRIPCDQNLTKSRLLIACCCLHGETNRRCKNHENRRRHDQADQKRCLNRQQQPLPPLPAMRRRNKRFPILCSATPTSRS